MSRFRFTVRRMMVAVASIAVAIGAFRMYKKATYYAERAAHYRSLANPPALWKPSATTVEEMNKEILEFNRKIDTPYRRHYNALAAKYTRAARYPWLLVTPDPPEPE